MSGKHTPAPWRGMYSETKKHGRVLSAIYQPIPGQEYGSLSTVVSLRLVESYSGGEYFGADCWMQIRPEDAALILKAPEMLAALERLVAWWDQDTPLVVEGVDRASELVGTARALLAELKEVE